MNEPREGFIPSTARPTAEFEIEGDLRIISSNGCAVFKIDDCHLSEFVARHFGLKWNDRYERLLGRCKVIITPIEE